MLCCCDEYYMKNNNYKFVHLEIANVYIVSFLDVCQQKLLMHAWPLITFYP